MGKATPPTSVLVSLFSTFFVFSSSEAWQFWVDGVDGVAWRGRDACWPPSAQQLGAGQRGAELESSSVWHIQALLGRHCTQWIRSVQWDSPAQGREYYQCDIWKRVTTQRNYSDRWDRLPSPNRRTLSPRVLGWVLGVPFSVAHTSPSDISIDKYRQNKLHH